MIVVMQFGNQPIEFGCNKILAFICIIQLSNWSELQIMINFNGYFPAIFFFQSS